MVPITRILITGSRDWWQARLLKETIKEWADLALDGEPVIIHGNCPTGADQMADEYARAMNWGVQRFRADWTGQGLAAGPIRNQLMVDAGADLCLAFPLPGSKGTWDCIRRAQAAGIPTLIIEGGRRGPGDSGSRASRS